MWASDIRRAESGCQTAYYGLICVILLMVVCGVGFGVGVSHELSASKETEVVVANEAVVSPYLRATGQAQRVDFTFVLARVKGLSSEEAERIFAQFKTVNPTLDCSYDVAERGEYKVIRVHLSLPESR